MNREERARQFLSYDSLRGYKDTMREVNHRREPRRDMTEDRAEKLSRAVLRLEKGMQVSVIWYRGDHYEEWEGVLTGVQLSRRLLSVDNHRILFDDLWDIRILCSTIKENP
jgi:hypothetical protein